MIKSSIFSLTLALLIVQGSLAMMPTAIENHSFKNARKELAVAREQISQEDRKALLCEKINSRKNDRNFNLFVSALGLVGIGIAYTYNDPLITLFTGSVTASNISNAITAQFEIQEKEDKLALIENK